MAILYDGDQLKAGKVQWFINDQPIGHSQGIGGMQDADIERQTMLKQPTANEVKGAIFTAFDAAKHIMPEIKHEIEINLSKAAPIKSIQGPHMYQEDCHCDHCSEYRAKRDAGMNINIDTVRREAELTQGIAADEHRKIPGQYYSTTPDPVMSIPASVVLDLCDKAGKGYDGFATRDACYELDTKNRGLAKENRQLQAEKTELSDLIKQHEMNVAYPHDTATQELLTTAKAACRALGRFSGSKGSATFDEYSNLHRVLQDNFGGEEDL